MVLMPQKMDTLYWDIPQANRAAQNLALIEDINFIDTITIPNYVIVNNKKYTGPTNNVLIQFWWRPWLTKDTFEKSKFYKNVSAFLLDDRLKQLAKKYNVNFLFKLHCEMEKYSKLFNKFTNVTMIPNSDLFEPLFIKSSLLITDFTSNVYEMGMINKPCLYYEPD